MSSTPNAPGASHSAQVNSGAYRRGVYCLEPQIIVAADVDHEEALTGVTLDRTIHSMPLSMQFCFPMKLALASGEEATVAVEIEDAGPTDPDDPTDESVGSFADYGDEQPADVTLRGNDSGDPLETEVRVNVDFAGARRYVRANLTITIPGSGESVALAGVAIIGGAETLPL
jgi:hypothetical protein